MGGSSKGGGQKGGGQTASAAPTVAAPPVSQAASQQQLNLEQQFVESPWSVPGWQSNVNPTNQGLQQQYLGEGSTASQSSDSNDMLAQWLFGGSTSEGTT